MSAVAQLVPVAEREQDLRQRQVVEVLEALLEKAKTGAYRQLVAVAELADTSELEISYTGCPDLYRLAGQLERLKLTMLRRMDR